MNSIFILSGLGILSLLAEIINFRKVLFPLVILGLLGTVGVLVMDWGSQAAYFNNMLLFDHYAIAFSAGLAGIAALWFLMSKSYFEEKTHVTDHFALVIFSLIGGIFMVSYSNLSMLFLGIEILSIPLYVLAGSKMKDLSSNESAFKYFLMGSFATGFLLFGIALIYGVTGSFSLDVITGAIAANNSPLAGFLYVGILMMLVGLAFKVSAAPFHFWAPDVYQGAPTVVTAFMSTIVKIAAFAAFYRLFSSCFSQVAGEWRSVVYTLSILTLAIGNITAVFQNSVKRMLAYSSVAHAGYMLISLISLNEFSSSSIFYYVIAYSVASLASFTVLLNVAGENNDATVEAFNGLGKRNPFLAFTMTVALLSLAGIPPLAGFFAKYYLFNAAFHRGLFTLVLIAVIASLIGVYYYFRIIIAMYLKDPVEPEPIKVSTLHKILAEILLLITIALGLAPDFFISLL
jgi:NADH-quinone oxidoreductase subunit N